MQATNNYKMDEFGRDVSLKQQFNYLSKFKGMKWEEICFVVEDEEARQKNAAKKEELRKIMEYRKRLVDQGLYDLEEGEIVEM